MTTILIVLIAFVFVIVIGVMALGICYYARDNCDELLAEREQRELQRLTEQPKPQPNVGAGFDARPNNTGNVGAGFNASPNVGVDASVSPKKSPTKPIKPTMPNKPNKPNPTNKPNNPAKSHPRDAHGRFTKQSSKPTKK